MVTIAPMIPGVEKIKPYILPIVLIMLLALLAVGIRYYIRNFMSGGSGAK